MLFLISAITSGAKARNEVLELRQQLTRMQACVPDADTLPCVDDEPVSTNDVDQIRTLLMQKNREVDALLMKLALYQGRQGDQQELNELPVSLGEHMERLKEEDRGGYAELIKLRGESQRRMRYDLAEHTATFMNLDTSSMTEDELANHELLVTKMGIVWSLTEQFQDPEATPDRDAMSELYNEVRLMQPMLDVERTAMIKQLGTDLGYTNEAAEDFVAQVDSIIKTTLIRLPDNPEGVSVD